MTKAQVLFSNYYIAITLHLVYSIVFLSKLSIMTFDVKCVNSHYPDVKYLIDMAQDDPRNYPVLYKFGHKRYIENIVIGYIFDTPISFGALTPKDDSTVSAIFLTSRSYLCNNDLFKAMLRVLEDKARYLDYSTITAECNSEESEIFKMDTSFEFNKMPFQKHCSDNTSEMSLFKVLVD